MTANASELARRQENLSEILLHLAQEVTACHEPDMLYRSLLIDMRKLVECMRAVIYLCHDSAQELYPVAELACTCSANSGQEACSCAVKTKDVQWDNVSPKSTNARVIWAAAHRRSLLHAPAQQGQEGCQTASFLASMPAEMAVPLISKDALYGVILLQRTEPFTDEELQLLRSLSSMATVALENVQLFQKARTSQTRFLSLITHELRSPLNSINGYLDLALSGVAGEINEHLREFLVRSRAASEHLYAQLEDLLLVARADMGQWRLNRKVLKLQDVVADTVEELELTSIDQEVTVMIEGIDTLPPLYADAVRLQQVLRNLLSNALHCTEPGGQATISAQVERNDGRYAVPSDHKRVVVLQVRDTGCGIAPEYQQCIFERFYQIPNSAGPIRGQGLGLAVVKMVVELHGGYITVESKLEQGSTFSCILPCLLS